MEVIKLFDIPKDVINDNERQRRVYSVDGISPAILGRSDCAKIMEAKLGNIFGFTGGNYAGNVYDKNYMCPTLNTMQGGCKQPMIIDDTYANREPRVYDYFSPSLRSEREGFKTIVAMRGRNPENPSDRTVGSPTEQRLEPNSQGICNTLTSVTKDNLVMEVKQVGFMDNGTGKHQSNTVYDEKGVCPNITTIDGGTQQIKVATETVKIKQATSQGYIECELGGVADLSFPDSKTRRGGVQENGQVSPALMAGDQDICRIEKNPVLVGGIGEKWGEKQYRQGNRVYDSDSVAMALTAQPLGNNGGNSYMYLTRETQYRIRKLTPLECWRLMDFKDEDFHKAAEVNSNTQLYKQAGNSIVRNVLVAIMGQMIPGKEEVYKNI